MPNTAANISMFLTKYLITEQTPSSLLGYFRPPNTDRFLVTALGAAFLFYFVVRGWLSAIFVVICLYCIARFCANPVNLKFLFKNKNLFWMMIAFAAPIVAASSVQIAHKEFVPRYLEVPARLLLAGGIMVYLAQQRLNFVRIAEYVFPLAALFCAGMVYLYPGAAEFYWGGRVATSFIDPLTLSQHIVIVGFMCLFLVNATGKDRLWLKALKYSGIVAAAAVGLGTQSRTGWTMVPILAVIWLTGQKQFKSAKKITAAIVLVGCACVAVYFASDIVKERIDKAVLEVYAYFHGGSRDTSLGIRLSMFKTNWLLFWQKPFLGWGFHEIPSLVTNPEIAALATPLFTQFFVHSGGHNELLQNMMRMGILGLISRLMLFFVPMIIFINSARSTLPNQRAAGYLGLAVTIGYLMAGLTSEVFNLIYAASFYALIIAALVASTTVESHHEQA